MCTQGWDVVVLMQSWTHIALTVFMFSSFFPRCREYRAWTELKLCMTHLWRLPPSPPATVNLYFLDPNTQTNMQGTIVIKAQMITALSSPACEFFTKTSHSCKESWTLVRRTYGGGTRVVAWSVCLLYTTLSSHTDTAPISTVNSEGMWAVFNCIWTLTRHIGGDSFRDVKFEEHGPWREKWCAKWSLGITFSKSNTTCELTGRKFTYLGK